MKIANGELEEILDEAGAVFGWSEVERPQKRAHAYLIEHKVNRSYDDTAMEAACRDMISRAYELGLDSAGPQGVDVERLREIADDLCAALEEN